MKCVKCKQQKLVKETLDEKILDLRKSIKALQENINKLKKQLMPEPAETDPSNVS